MHWIARFAVVLSVLMMLAAPVFLILALPVWESQQWNVPLLFAAGCSALQGFVLMLFGVFGAAVVKLEHASDQAAVWIARMNIARLEQIGRNSE